MGFNPVHPLVKLAAWAYHQQGPHNSSNPRQYNYQQPIIHTLLHSAFGRYDRDKAYKVTQRAIRDQLYGKKRG